MILISPYILEMCSVWSLVSVSVVCGVERPGPKIKALGILIFLEVVGIGPRNIRKIPENSKYA